MIKLAQFADAQQIAILHQQTISKGFLTNLGLDFLQNLYFFLIKKELILTYKENDQVVGFVSCAISSKGIMKRFVITEPIVIAKLLVLIINNPKIVKQMLETFRAPSLSKSKTCKVPDTELLSISVSPLSQQGGIGTQLLSALEFELKKRNITTYKVIAGEKLHGANKFYLKNGFKRFKQISIHSDDISNVYIKEI